MLSNSIRIAQSKVKRKGDTQGYVDELSVLSLILDNKTMFAQQLTLIPPCYNLLTHRQPFKALTHR